MATVTKPIALDESLNTTESPSRNVADVLAQELSAVATAIGGIAVPSADHVSYDNSVSGLSATDVQNALDEIVSEIPTVNDGTLTIQQNGETKGTFTANQSGDSTVNIEIPTTDIQTAVDEFETYNGGLLSSLKVSLSPNQDLHGYSEPWVGGAGKNKVGLNHSPQHAEYVSAGLSISDRTDYSVTLEVTSAGTYQSLWLYYSLKAGTYTASVKTESSDSVSPTVSIYKDVDNTLLAMGIAQGVSRTFTIASDMVVNIRFFATGGDSTLRTVRFYEFQLEEGSTATTFESYTNICPISGHTQSKVGDDGKNWLPNEATSQTVNGVTFDINNDGSITLNNQSTADWTGITLTSAKFLKAGTYTVSCPRVNNVDTRLIISYDGAEKVNTYNVDYKTFTLTEDKIVSVRFVIRNSGVSFSNVTYYPMIELGSTATAYVPYNGYQVTVNLGGTYYSGVLEVVTGVFTPDTAEREYDGSVDEGWSIQNVVDGNTLFISTVNIPLPNYSTKYQCSVSNPNTAGSSTPTAGTYIYNSTLRVRVTPDVASTVEDFTTWLSNNPLQIVYELATPTSIQLSPTTVKALVGENHLSAPLDGQEITESKYKQMFTFDDVIAYIQSLS